MAAHKMIDRFLWISALFFVCVLVFHYLFISHPTTMHLFMELFSSSIDTDVDIPGVLKVSPSNPVFITVDVSIDNHYLVKTTHATDPNHYTIQEQAEYIKQYGQDCSSGGGDAYDAFSHLLKTAPTHAVELFKFCFSQHELQRNDIVRFKHGESFLLDENYMFADGNYAVIDVGKQMVHGSLLVVTRQQEDLMKKMTDYMISSFRIFEFEPFSLSRKFYELIQEQVANEVSWNLLQLVCDVDGSNGIQHRCQIQLPLENDVNGRSVGMGGGVKAVMLSKRQYLPYRTIPPSVDLQQPLQPLNSTLGDDDLNVHYMTTITVKATNRKPVISETPNFFEILSSKKCLPNSDICDACMKTAEGGNCARCHKFCGCFCDYLCQTKMKDKVVSKVLEYRAPLYKRANDESPHGEKLIPRIVHQTWLEPLEKDKYPNFSRFANSWKRKNWEYRFYDDHDTSNFLLAHFPPEVKEAYDTLIPEAFKADLFRYCVLFIHGGVYADVDVLLESNLDMIIDDDVGFMVPLDADPGKKDDHTMCLWNGLLAAAPGHPFLAAVIETVVNNVRNKFTSVDIMQSMCPDVDLYVARKWDLLHTSGPCILGASINRFLGRHSQASFEPTNSTDYSNENVPGRFIILQANKKDMGSHRFTSIEKNAIVTATDLPDSDDRRFSLGHTQEKNHYSRTRKKGQMYGVSGLYADNNIANEVIRFEAAPK